MITQLPVFQLPKKSSTSMEIKDKSDDVLKKQWQEMKKENAADKKLKNMLKAIVIRNAKEATNKDLDIYKDPEIMEACK